MKQPQFWLNPVALAESVGYNTREPRQLRELVEEYHDLLRPALRRTGGEVGRYFLSGDCEYLALKV